MPFEITAGMVVSGYSPIRSEIDPAPLMRRLAEQGAKPAELPVEQLRIFEIAINLKTAKQIGVTISPEILSCADKVIK